jgi:Spy/CpxP family protein refolding chaperone
MEALMVWRLTEELNLTEDQSAQFFPKWRKIRLLREQYRQERNAVLDGMASLLKEPAPSVSELRSLVDSLETMEEDFRASQARLRRELYDVLTVDQQVRLILFQRNFEHDTRRAIEGIRGARNKRSKGDWR